MIATPGDLLAEEERRVEEVDDRLVRSAIRLDDDGKHVAVACADLEYLETRAARGSQEAFERVLAKVPAVEPLPGDEL